MRDDALRKQAAAHGVDIGYHDVEGRWHDASPETLRAVLAALAVEEQAATPAAIVVTSTRPRQLPGWLADATLVLEDGCEAPAPELLPGELPRGYHRLVARGGQVPLIVAPDRAYLPRWLEAGGRAWGVAAQLYAITSDRSWGIGELADLGPLARVLGSPDFLLLSPLHAPAPGPVQQASPYTPSSRRYLNPLHLALADVPEEDVAIGEARVRWRELAAKGRALSASPLVDRDAVWKLKREALALLRPQEARLAALERRLDADPELARFARFCALAEQFGPAWRSWPPGAEAPGEAVRLHAYAQLLLAEQLAAVPRLRLGLVTDLAVGAAADGFDAWSRPDIVCDGLKLGAPPDALGPAGQDWGLPVWRPWALAAAGYEPFAATLRAAMTGAAGVRIDHVMGLSRVFAIPAGADPSGGTYVRMPLDDLLGVVALESERARCLVVGEDLGTVEQGFREAVAERGLLSYRLALFEEGGSCSYPRATLAAIATHDLPTVAGLVTGADARELAELGVVAPHEAAPSAARDAARVARWRAGLDAEGIDAGEGTPRSLARGLHEQLARGSAMLVCASLEDALGVERRPNVPGTVDERPNWRIRLPAAVEQIALDSGVASTLAPLRHVE